jgi:hypothetical protein
VEICHFASGQFAPRTSVSSGASVVSAIVDVTIVVAIVVVVDFPAFEPDAGSIST